MKLGKGLVIFTLFTWQGVAGQYYPVSEIPDSLKENAHCIVRLYSDDLEVSSTNNASETIRKAITVLDKEGELSAGLRLTYDKNSYITINNISIFDANGHKIKTIRQSEIEDYSAYQSFELYSESRVKAYEPESPIFPYTIEYNYERDRKNLISLGRWMPVTDYSMSLQEAVLKLIHPVRVKVNFKELNIKGQTEIKGDIRTDTWKLYNLKAIETEPFSVSIEELVPSVYMMPSLIRYEKYEGSAENWEEYGRWVYDLFRDRDDLAQADSAKVLRVIENIKDVGGKVRALYKYMQDNTRYVSVTLGLGGYQPTDARSVFKTGYGDCKALSNYLFSLLKFAQVESYPALVVAGSGNTRVFRDFPNFSQLNHVILCVPTENDTIWLECTNQKIPFGFLGDFTDDRDVLLITRNGGRFAHTPKYEAHENLRAGLSEFRIDSTGTGRCESVTRFTGLQYDNLSSFLASGPDERKKWLYANSSLPSLQINDFKVTEKKERKPEVIIKESEVSKNYCSFSGNYLILPLNLVNAMNPVQKMVRQRLSPVVIHSSFFDSDTIIYNLPSNYKPDALPKGTVINSGFGNYISSVANDGEKIIYTRQFELREGRFSPEKYKEFYDFMLQVSKADNTKIILSKISGS